MTKLNVHEAKTEPPHRPKIGFAKGTFTVPDTFFEPLPTDLLDAFGGSTAACWSPRPSSTAVSS
jgi:hypothetical protein